MPKSCLIDKYGREIRFFCYKEEKGKILCCGTVLTSSGKTGVGMLIDYKTGKDLDGDFTRVAMLMRSTVTGVRHEAERALQEFKDSQAALEEFKETERKNSLKTLDIST